MPLNEYIDQSDLVLDCFSQVQEYDLANYISHSDGNIYYMPGIDLSNQHSVDQILWINQKWLANLNLEIPRTIDDLINVLRAFRDNDPNGNGIKDELPLVGSFESLGLRSYDFLINSFVYNDVDNSRFYLEEGNLVFAPVSDGWRKAMIYLNQLYSEDLLHSSNFDFTKNQLMQLVNDPRSLVGALTCSSVTEIMLSNSPEIIGAFVQVPPLSFDNKKANIVRKTALPSVHGFILNSSDQAEQVFELFELMYSEDAFLRGRYGQYNVDWQHANENDLDLYGSQALIKVNRPLDEKPQNSHLRDTGPYWGYAKYIDGISWNGIQADSTYMDARTYMVYSKFFPQEYLISLNFSDDNNFYMETKIKIIDNIVLKSISDFVSGKVNPKNDKSWSDYLKKLENQDLSEIISAAEKSWYGISNEVGE